MITQFKIFEKIDKYLQKVLDNDLYHYSSKKSALQKLRDLIKAGANVNYITDRGWTPLMRTAFFSFTSWVELLIENGAEINLTNDDGFSAIMIAASDAYNFSKYNSNKKIVDILIENNADLNIQNTKGQDIFDINEKTIEYINNKFPEKYKEYLEKKEANKYNL